MTLAVRQDDTQTARPDSRDYAAAAPLIIVGAGPVGIRVADELLGRGFAGRVVMFGDEPARPYNRIRLSSLLAGEIGLDAIDNACSARDAGRVELINCAVQGIFPDQRQVEDATGARHDYSRLILATGSRPHVPDVPGVDRSGVFTFRSLRDVERLMARGARSRRTLVVGGGLLGIEASRAMQRASTRVALVHQGGWLMNRQLDETAAQRLQQRLEALGIELCLGAGLAEVLGSERVEGIRLRDGRVLPGDTVLLATGIRPNIDLARRAWIRVGTGIQVDDQLRTSAEHVYAVGECVEHRGVTYGLVAPGYEQAAALAEALLGGPALYGGSVNASQLKIAGAPVFSCGEVVDPLRRARQRDLCWQDADSYRRLLVHRGRLIGALAIGACPESRRLQEAVRSRRRLGPLQRLRFRLTGRCWSDAAANVSAWPEETIVCQCMSVRRGRLTLALESGCTSVADLGRDTGAGTVCGGCRPLLQELTGGERRAETTATPLWLAGLGVLTMVGGWLATPGLPVAQSAQSAWQPDRIWNDGFASQVTGFTLLGIALLGLLLSLRKSVPAFRLGGYPWWRLFHVLTGLLCLVLLVAHTGFHSGSNLNRMLLVNFIGALLLGAFAALAIGQAHRLSAVTSRRLGRALVWGHVLLVWPLPVLVGVHVLTVYYF